jgi:hypothetical protein
LAGFSFSTAYSNNIFGGVDGCQSAALSIRTWSYHVCLCRLCITKESTEHFDSFPTPGDYSVLANNLAGDRKLYHVWLRNAGLLSNHSEYAGHCAAAGVYQEDQVINYMYSEECYLLLNLSSCTDFKVRHASRASQSNVLSDVFAQI